MKRAIFNQKGGVGKTSITCNLAAAMAARGQKVLVIDLDSQGNATRYLLGRESEEVTETIADFFAATLGFKIFRDSLKQAVYRSRFENLFVVPAERSLAELQPKLEARYKIFKLGQAVDELREREGFDQVFFDTPPALNFYSMSALMAADTVLIPFDCDAFSADALSHVMDIINEVKEDHRPNLRAEGIVINNFQAGARLPMETIERLLRDGYEVLTPYLSASIAMRESHALEAPLVHCKPSHKLTREFLGLADRLLGDTEELAPRKRRPTEQSL